MTTIYNGIKVLTYVEWLEMPGVKELCDEIDECSTCDGSGEHVCDCGNTHECEECDGSGKATEWRALYEKELRDEVIRLQTWIEGKPFKHIRGLIQHKPDDSFPLLISIPGTNEN